VVNDEVVDVVMQEFPMTLAEFQVVLSDILVGSIDEYPTLDHSGPIYLDEIVERFIRLAPLFRSFNCIERSSVQGL
jgi:hypothetical protein